jgi:hypothetical protein
VRDPRLIELKRLAEIDPRLSDGAHRVLALIVSEVYSDPHFLLDSPRRLPWTWFDRIIGLCRDQYYGRMRELVFLGYLAPGPLMGCPPERSYYLTHKGRHLPSLKRLEKPSLDGGEKPSIKGRQIRSIKGRQNTAPLYKLSLREEMNTKAGGAAQSAGAGKTKPPSAATTVAAGAASKKPAANPFAGLTKAFETEAARVKGAK